MLVSRSLKTWWLRGRRDLLKKQVVTGTILSVIAFTTLMATAYGIAIGPKALFSFLTNALAILSFLMSGGVFYLRANTKNRPSSRAENAFYLLGCLLQVGIGIGYILSSDHAMAMIALAITTWVGLALIAYVVTNLRKDWNKLSDVDYFIFPVIVTLGSFALFLMVKALPDHWVALMRHVLFAA